MKAFILSFCIIWINQCYSQTQLEINFQTASKYKVVDARLNKVYKELLSKIPSRKEKDLLIKAERAWIIYRDTQAEYLQEQYDGGSFQQTVYFEALIELTEDRIRQLKEFIRIRNN